MSFFTCPGRVAAVIAFDQPRHVRLPINGDEIIDRALAIQASVGRDNPLVTYDTKMRLRARTAGLTVNKLQQDPGPDAQWDS